MDVQSLNKASPDKEETYSLYQKLRYFPELDGLRAISVLMVLAFHTGDIIWVPLNGYLGVTVFFVISGMLITTLLLREEDRNGKVSVRNFYIRRAFRIFPLYYLALLIFSVLVIVFGLGANPDNYLDRLPLLAIYLGEFAGSGTFSHSWSLGIEEKFYLVWPLLLFVTVTVRKLRGWIISFLLIASIASVITDELSYFAIYTPILAGSLLALLMHNERTFYIIFKLTTLIPLIIIWIITIVLLLTNNEDSYIHIPFSIAIMLLLPSLLIGPYSIRKILKSKILAFIGTRTYAIYLFHPLVIAIVDKVIIEGSSSLLIQALRLCVISVLTLGVADVLFRFMENPLIRFGRRLTLTNQNSIRAKDIKTSLG